ncbi:hypothetical protein D9757_007022 [Collybiopsis confluens]|uniref:Uncharacterized protein n=1 Tax=Collybiopsis confluens TaxID=2823264 RepID=A0A8H5HC74_9AGAR|nr:hypothetical protein D9757_007022 [Collybiopsis confluens]
MHDSSLNEPSDFASIPLIVLPMAVFNSSILILLNLWSGKRLGMMVDAQREMEDVYRCLEILKDYGKIQQNAGMLYDIIKDLISMSGADSRHSATNTFHQSSCTSRGKRARNIEGGRDVHEKQAIFDGNRPISTYSFEPTTVPFDYRTGPLHSSNNTQNMPDTSYPSVQTASTALASHSYLVNDNQPTLFGLPLHTEDLGNLPVLLKVDHNEDSSHLDFPMPEMGRNDYLR